MKYYLSSLTARTRALFTLVICLALLPIFSQKASAFSVYVKADTAPYIYVWYKNSNGTLVKPNGAWGSTKAMTESSTGWYVYNAPKDATSISFILTSSTGTKLTGDITGVTSDVYYAVSGTSASVTTKRPTDDNTKYTFNIYAKSASAPYIYVWYTSGSSTVEPNGAYKKAGAMTEYSPGWYVYTYSSADVSKINFLFKKTSTGDDKYATGDLSTSITSGNNVDVYYTIGTTAATTTDTPESTKDYTGSYNIVLTNAASNPTKTVVLPFVASRVRNSQTVSTRLYSINVKNDQLVKWFDSDDIYYYIATTAGLNYYSCKSSSGNYVLGSQGVTTTAKGTNVKEETYDNLANDRNTPLKLALGTGVSYTWLLDNKDGTDLTIDINLEGLAEAPEKSYYVICNAADATSGETIKPWLDANRIKMTRYAYLKSNKTSDGTPYGVVSTEDWNATTMDSIVYRVTVPRPSTGNGWGDFFILVDNASEVEGSKESDWTGTKWNPVIRPQVQGYGSQDSTDPTAKGMDGQALEGGLFRGAKNIKNNAQALNPQLTTAQSNATSYTFSMNITTSTYRIAFNDENFYIMGPAVCSNASDENAWTTTYADNAKMLTWVESEQCFKYLGSDGNEQPMHLNAGAAFRFVYGKDFRNTWFGEDSNVPCDLSTSDKEYTATTSTYD